MALKLKSREIDGVVVVDLIGRLTCGDPQMLFRNAVRRLVDEGNSRLVLNLSDVNFVDSSGLAELVSTRHLVTERLGDVNLMGLARRVKDLLVITKLVTAFACFEEESKAVAALQGHRDAVRRVTS
jgi:anti-sigma B factor antagonist